MSDLGRYLAFWPMPRARANRAIDAGDAARGAGRWQQAAEHYWRAVAIQPRRRPIWVQLGHAEKEAGRPQAALEAYGRAMLLSTDDGEQGEAALYHGLQARSLGQWRQAKASLAIAFAENRNNPAISQAWREILHDPLAASEQDSAVAKLLLKAERQRWERQGGKLLFEVTDLLHHWRHARLPTGVQRVQMEVIRAAFDQQPGLRICCFVGGEGGWVLLPAEPFMGLCRLALVDGDDFAPEWIAAVEMLAATVGLASPVGFRMGDILVNPGTSWTLPNYFLHLRHARQKCGLVCVPFVHDLIPVAMPETCLPGVVRDFLRWVGGVFDHADRLLANSHSTAADLVRVAGVLGHQAVERNVEVVTLDAPLSSRPKEVLPEETLARWGLVSGRYVLFVSSIEPRKNHRMALRAWQGMLMRDEAGTPELVCVGHGGWLNDPVYAMLREHPALAAKVKVLSGIADDELVLLYRHCCFTLYPSLYEGWGMPVTESLSHGKVPVVTRCSSLTEAGGDFAVYVEPGDAGGLAETVMVLWHDDLRRGLLEERILRDFRPRSWAQVAEQICTAALNLNPMCKPQLPRVVPDTICRMGASRAMHLVPGAQLGEMLRHGLGWELLVAEQARTAPGGGALAFCVAQEQAMSRCHLRLIPAESEAVITLRTEQGEYKASPGWFSLDLPVVDGRVDLWLSGGAAVSHLVVSDAVDPAQIATRIAGGTGSHYAALCDIHVLILGMEADAAALAEFLPPLEAGGLTRAQLVTILQKRSDGQI